MSCFFLRPTWECWKWGVPKRPQVFCCLNIVTGIFVGIPKTVGCWCRDRCGHRKNRTVVGGFKIPRKNASTNHVVHKSNAICTIPKSFMGSQPSPKWEFSQGQALPQSLQQSFLSEMSQFQFFTCLRQKSQKKTQNLPSGNWYDSYWKSPVWVHQL